MCTYLILFSKIIHYMVLLFNLKISKLKVSYTCKESMSKPVKNQPLTAECDSYLGILLVRTCSHSGMKDKIVLVIVVSI